MAPQTPRLLLIREAIRDALAAELGGPDYWFTDPAPELLEVVPNAADLDRGRRPLLFFYHDPGGFDYLTEDRRFTSGNQQVAPVFMIRGYVWGADPWGLAEKLELDVRRALLKDPTFGSNVIKLEFDRGAIASGTWKRKETEKRRGGFELRIIAEGQEGFANA